MDSNDYLSDALGDLLVKSVDGTIGIASKAKANPKKVAIGLVSLAALTAITLSCSHSNRKSDNDILLAKYQEATNVINALNGQLDTAFADLGKSTNMFNSLLATNNLYLTQIGNLQLDNSNLTVRLNDALLDSGKLVTPESEAVNSLANTSLFAEVSKLFNPNLVYGTFDTRTRKITSENVMPWQMSHVLRTSGQLEQVVETIGSIYNVPSYLVDDNAWKTFVGNYPVKTPKDNHELDELNRGLTALASADSHGLIFFKTGNPYERGFILSEKDSQELPK